MADYDRAAGNRPSTHGEVDTSIYDRTGDAGVDAPTSDPERWDYEPEDTGGGGGDGEDEVINVTLFGGDMDMTGNTWTDAGGVPREYLPAGSTILVTTGDDFGIWTVAGGSDPATRTGEIEIGVIYATILGQLGMAGNQDTDIETAETFMITATTLEFDYLNQQVISLSSRMGTAEGQISQLYIDREELYAADQDIRDDVIDHDGRINAVNGRVDQTIQMIEDLDTPRASLGSHDPVQAVFDEGDPIVTVDPEGWANYEIREHDGPVFDPITEQWVCAYTGIDINAEPDGDPPRSLIGFVLSSDSLEWTYDEDNPVIANLEDPCFVRTPDGNMWRDSDGRAHIYGEEKAYAQHRGIKLFKSGIGTLSDWTEFGRVIDQGVSGWDSIDRTSPTVIFDPKSNKLILLYEGRGPGQDGMTGYATSDDEGETWTVAPDPIIVRGVAGTWNETSIVPDYLTRIGAYWVMLTHGADINGVYKCGRYVTVENPADWDVTSFLEMPGNPWSESETITAFGSDSERVTVVVGGSEIRVAHVRGVLPT